MSKWYYLNPDGDRVAFTESDLPVLVGAGEVQSRSLIWHKGRDSWISCGEIRPELFQPGATQGTVAELGRQEVTAMVAAGRVKPPFLKAVAVLFFGLAGAMLISLLLIPLCWIPMLLGIHLLKAASCLDTAGSTGELRAWHLHGIRMEKFWKWALISLISAILVVLTAAVLGFLINAGTVDPPSWLRGPDPAEQSATRSSAASPAPQVAPEE